MSKKQRQLVLQNATVATMRPEIQTECGLLSALQTISIRDGLIESIAPSSTFTFQPGAETINLAGRLVTPGLIDCHTHLVFAGDRSAEWRMRLAGTSYEDIARSGGGILSTVRSTRTASEQELFEQGLERLSLMAQNGVTCVEIKSGYGLSLEQELKILRVIRRLKEAQPIELAATLLAAHAVPPEYQGDADGYVRAICDSIIPRTAAEGLAESVDVFCESVAFSLAQCEKIFDAAQAHGLSIKAHAEQLSCTGCAVRAAERGALSVDHLEHLSAQDAAALRPHQTVAVLLPGAFYAMREKQSPPVAALRAAGVPMAVATDCNPGTSPFSSLRLMMNFACILFSLSPGEALGGVTRHAAQALGRQGRIGTITPGHEATLCVWDTQDSGSIALDLSRPLLYRTFIRGEARHA